MSTRALLTVIALVLHSQFANAEPISPKCPGLVGTWAADVDVGVFHGPLALRISPDPTGALGAKMYAPAYWTERPNGGAVWNFRRDGRRVAFDIHGAGWPHADLFPFVYLRGRPGKSPWTYIGTISADGSAIRGKWTEDGETRMSTDFECVVAKTE